MKRFAIIAFMLMASLAASASSVHYFTRSQADRAVVYLNQQNELMIYCGYDYEIETYVLLNEVWAEKVNSAYYELWIYGYDAYTGEEIYMPVDLQCVWLRRAGRMYNAAQYLRFRTTGLHTPTFAWYVPTYRPYTRVLHRPGFVRTYHYDVHVHGWRPPHRHSAAHAIHPYYMRQPGTPAPRPTAAWTPGVDRPHIVAPDAAGRNNSVRSGATVVPSNPANGTRSGAATSPSNQQSTRTAPANNNQRSGSSTTSSRSTTTSTPASNNQRSGSSTTSSRSTTTSTPASNNQRSGSSTTSSRSTTTSTPANNNQRSGSSTTSSRSTTTSTPASNNQRSGSSTTSSRSTTTSTPASNNQRSGSSTPSSRSTNTSSRSNNSQGRR